MLKFCAEWAWLAEAAGVGKVRHNRLVNLIGCCADGDERITSLCVGKYVLELLPHCTSARVLQY
ncbi:hypothetical protein M8C21_032393, partial [Ambrosia artemisiifolia]